MRALAAALPILFGILFGLVTETASPASAPADTVAPSAVADTLSFEFADSSGAPAGGGVWMPPTRWDPAAPHGGRAAARIDRDSTSANEFSAFSRSIPADFAGDTLELRGWLRTENVRGCAGLWLREDRAPGVSVGVGVGGDRW